MLVGALCYHRVKVAKPNIQHSDETIHAEHPAHTAPPAAAQPLEPEEVTLSGVLPTVPHITTPTATQPPVIYEEVTLSGSRQNIELKENVCYGPI